MIACNTGCVPQGGSADSQTVWVPATIAEFTTPEDLRGLMVIMPVSYEGKNYLFLVDSGTTSVVLDESFRRHLGTPVAEMKAAYSLPGSSSQAVKFYRCPDIFLGSFNIKRCGHVAVLDMSPFSSLYGYPIAGIIGMSVLRNFVVEINIASGMTRILAPTICPNIGGPISLQYDKQLHPYILAKLPNNQEIALIVDTGCSYDGAIAKTSLSLLPEHAVSSRPTDRVSSVIGFAGGEIVCEQQQTVKLSELSLGELVHRQISFNIASESSLGLGLLSCHKVTFDFPGSRMYLEGFHDPVQVSRPFISGLVLAKRDGVIVVRDVIHKGPAEDAGIRSGDIVVKIGDMETSHLDVAQAGNILRSYEPDVIMLTIQRGSHEFQAKIVLKNGFVDKQ